MFLTTYILSLLICCFAAWASWQVIPLYFRERTNPYNPPKRRVSPDVNWRTMPYGAYGGAFCVAFFYIPVVNVILAAGYIIFTAIWLLQNKISVSDYFHDLCLPEER